MSTTCFGNAALLSGNRQLTAMSKSLLEVVVGNKVPCTISNPISVISREDLFCPYEVGV